MPALTHPASASPSKSPGSRAAVAVFLVLCFLFSACFWFVAARAAAAGKGGGGFLFHLGLMACPGVAALLTRLWFQRSLRGFGFGLRRKVWLVPAVFIPFLWGMVMFGSAWATGVAPIDPAKLAKILSLSFIPFFLLMATVACVMALGEEVGWRGFLVPELSRLMGFTGVALLSGAIWGIWHFPLILFSTYHGVHSVWLSLAAFTPYILAAGIVQAWFRLASGSLWPSVLLHGLSNYFTMQFFPYFTRTTPAGESMLGEFGWFSPALGLVVILVFWIYRRRLAKFD